MRYQVMNAQQAYDVARKAVRNRAHRIEVDGLLLDALDNTAEDNSATTFIETLRVYLDCGQNDVPLLPSVARSVQLAIDAIEK
jgi:hypothetical protein